ncbi:MAG: hypothetical protein FD167_4806, partial [bacterium]
MSNVITLNPTSNIELADLMDNSQNALLV